MKSTLQIVFILALVLNLVSCSSSMKTTAEYDDVYYQPSDQPVVAEPAATVVQKNAVPAEPMDDYEKYIASIEDGTYKSTEYGEENLQYYTDSLQYVDDPQYIDTMGYANQPVYVTNNYYSSGGGSGYSDPYYNSPGLSLGFGFGFPYFGFGFSYGYPYYPYYDPFYYGGYYDWYYPHYGYGYPYYGYGYPYYGYGYPSYGHGYNDGYYDGYYDDHKPAYYGPRRTIESQRTSASSGYARNSNTSPDLVGRRTSGYTNPTGSRGTAVTNGSGSRSGSAVNSTGRTGTTSTATSRGTHTTTFARP